MMRDPATRDARAKLVMRLLIEFLAPRIYGDLAIGGSASPDADHLHQKHDQTTLAPVCRV
jgi:hypothetical protein